MKITKEALGDFAPNAETVKAYSEIWAKYQDGKYAENDKVLFNSVEIFKGHNDFKKVLPKAVLLNYLYSTNVYNLRELVIAITKIDGLDKLISAGDISAVEKIANCGKGKRYYSFASKYCYMHNQKAFPIYDSIVKNILKILNRRDGFTTVKNADRYENYKQVYDDLISHYGLSDFSYRDIDKCLWVFGKTKIEERGK